MVITETNGLRSLGKALVRPGRLDVQMMVVPPGAQERLAIIRVHTRHIPLSEDVDLELMASDRKTTGLCVAESVLWQKMSERTTHAFKCSVHQHTEPNLTAPKD